MIEHGLCHESMHPRGLMNYIDYRRNFVREHPDYFYPDGLTIFVGPQGSGKTLSAVNYVYRLLEAYPKSILVSNVKLTDYPFDGQRVFLFEDNDDFSKYANGEYGIIFSLMRSNCISIASRARILTLRSSLRSPSSVSSVCTSLPHLRSLGVWLSRCESSFPA